MRKKVVIVGGGIAGLTAAHELIQRGFDVTVYEQRERFGGKAASNNDNGLPGEHGFRFFPGWYQHLPDTLKRIPYGGEGQRRTVYQNLVPAQTNLFASYRWDPIPALVRFPRSWSDLKTALSFPQRVSELPIPDKDFAFFLGRLIQFALTPEGIREAVYDKMTWWQFMEADQRSEAFRDYLVDGLTRNTVAAKPKVASAYTIGHVALRTLFDVFRPEGIDRVLNGPTNEAWINPWVSHLKAQGVELIPDAELVSIDIEQKRIRQIQIRRNGLTQKRIGAKLESLRLFRRLYQRANTGDTSNRAQEFLSCLKRLIVQPPEEMKYLVQEGPPGDHEKLEDRLRGLLEHWTTKFTQGHGRKLERELGAALVHLQAWQDCNQIYEWFDREYEQAWREYEDASATAPVEPVPADHFVFAMAVEQMAFYVHRSEMLRRVDPDLTKIILLSEQVSWMAGIQFYLTENERITPGHIDCIDSEWRLTAISQTQFWSDTYREPLEGFKVKAILSVDISAWDVKGPVFKKEAYACNRDEIAKEVWYQLKQSLNRPNRLPVLHDGMLLGSAKSDGKCVEAPGVEPVVPADSYHLDDDIVNRFDRKKQEFYKKFESVQFSSEAVRARQDAKLGKGALETAWAFGDRIELNAEPLLVNAVNSLAIRPGVETKITNMFLAADYVRTSTNLSTMEGANEAARAAVNAILRQAQRQEKPCRLWQWQPSDVLQDLQGLLPEPEGMRALKVAATPFHVAAGAAAKVSELATRAVARLTQRSK
jgi:uncharacterized protein with NAD-binding domain and iron-sulfur cluster